MSAEKTISTIIFDWGGVLQRTTSYDSRHLLDAELDLPLGSVEEAVFGSHVWQEASLGCCTGDEAWETIIGSLGFPLARADEFVRRFFAGDHIDQEIVGMIKRLSTAGYHVALLSNAPPGRSVAGTASARWGLEGLFELQVFSYQVGALKPDPRMYLRALELLQVPAHACLFIDDSLANVLAAQALGMAALHFGNTADLRAHLAAQFPDALGKPPARVPSS